MKITREEIKEMSNAIYDAGFHVYGVGNYDVDREQFCNILMVALTKDDKQLHLNRYYKILHDKAFISNKMRRRRVDG